MSEDQSSSAQSIGRGWVVLAALVLLVSLVYTLSHVFITPYPGLDFNGQWIVLTFDNPCETDPAWCERRETSLQIGDRMLVIGDLTYEGYRSSSNSIPFWPTQPGDLVPVVYERNGQIGQTTWKMLGPTPATGAARLVGLLTYLPFWLTGTGVLFFIRPRDSLWRLLVAFNYITALWIAAGVTSFSRVAASAVMLRVLTCVLPPVFLHLHLLVPVPRPTMARRHLVLPLYLVFFVLAAIGLVQPFSEFFYMMLMLIAILGSLAFLFLRLLRRELPSVRLALRLMLAGIGLAFGPSMVLYLIPGVVGSSIMGRMPIIFMTVAISLLPFFYAYALYKHRLGALELRANRILSLFSFLVIYATLFMFAFVLGSRTVNLTSEALAFSFVLSVGFVAIALPLRRPFERLIDRLAYGTAHSPDDIIRAFADEIPRALNQADLTGLLTREVMPSLLIRQSALFLVSQDEVTLYYADGVFPNDEELDEGQVRHFLAVSGRFRPLERDDRSSSAWVRLPLAIEVEGVVIGAWLLGKRDPDDFYPMRDIELLRTLANQVGVALETSRSLRTLEARATELRRAYNELQMLDRMKDEFVQNISHELRSPLTVVRGCSELMADGALGEITDQQREALARITERTDGIIRMVNDIIVIQRTAVEQLKSETVNMVDLVQSCVRSAEIVVQQGQNVQMAHEFGISVHGDVPLVWGDRQRLGQVLDNLLYNAMKFSPTGGCIQVDVQSCQSRLDDEEGALLPAVEVSVRDQGVGIPADQIDRIWERFYQVDGSSTRQFDGLGLGLAIVRQIVQTHGGRIWAESVVGQGSTFRFVLPAVVEQEAGMANIRSRFLPRRELV